MTHKQALTVTHLLRTLRTPSQWAETRHTGDDRIMVEFGTIHSTGERERALGHHMVEPSGHSVKYVGA